MHITRLDQTLYAVRTATVLTDGTVQADDRMHLTGNVLRFAPCLPGWIRTYPPFAVTLGPKSFARVLALAVGETATL